MKPIPTNYKSPRTIQIGGKNTAETNYITQVIQGVKPLDLRKRLKNLTTATKEDRLKEVEAWYSTGKIKSEALKLALEYVIQHIDVELKASQETIEELRKQGKPQLASVLEKLNEAFQKADVDQLLAASDEGMKKLKQDEAVIALDTADKLTVLLQYEKAEEKYKEAIELQKKAGMMEHPAYATSLNNLAELYRAQGKYEQAEPRYQEALKIDEKILGKEHPDYAGDLNNLALLYHDQGKYEQAEPRCQEALKIRKTVLGKEHPDYAQSLNNLAGLYRAQGKYEQAEPLYQEALRIVEKVLGKEHPEYATSLNNLAELYHDQGKYEQAEPRCQEALKIRKTVLGKEHPDYAQSLNNLAGLYHAQSKYYQAEPLFQEALRICLDVLGKDHPTTKTIQENLNHLLSQVSH